MTSENKRWLVVGGATHAKLKKAAQKEKRAIHGEGGFADEIANLGLEYKEILSKAGRTSAGKCRQ